LEFLPTHAETIPLLEADGPTCCIAALQREIPLPAENPSEKTSESNKLSRDRHRELRLNSMLLPLGKYIVIESPSIVTRHGSMIASDAS